MRSKHVIKFIVIASKLHQNMLHKRHYLANIHNGGVHKRHYLANIHSGGVHKTTFRHCVHSGGVNILCHITVLYSNC